MTEDRLETYLALLNAEVNMIKTPEIKALTQIVLQDIPNRTWTMRTSKNYHPVDERGYCGNIIHTLRVLKLSKLLLLEVDPEPWERDAAVSAAALHDCKKFGSESTMNWMHPKHAQLASETIRRVIHTEFTELSSDKKSMLELIAISVSNHMSKWQKEDPLYIPKLGTPLDLSLVLVLADFISAQSWISIDLGVD